MKVTSILFFLLVAITIAFKPLKKINIFMAGDSTMANKKPDRFPETGWGQVLGSFFTNDVQVNNFAINGRSTKSFITEKRWEKLVEQAQEGDYVFIQFGHNDEKITNPNLGKTLEEYKTNLSKFVLDVRAKNAIPVLFTPVMRRSIKAGVFYNSHNEYPEMVRMVAKEQNALLIDMFAKSKLLLEKTGPEPSKKLFLFADSLQWKNYPVGIRDNTHFSVEGANEMAKLCIEGVRELKLPLVKYLKK